MGLHFYDESPSHPAEQLGRLKPPTTLLKAGIPSAVWAEDALSIVHRVPTGLFTLQLLVPDDSVEAASEALCSLLPYRRMLEDNDENWRDYRLANPERPHAFNLNKDTILLQHTDPEGADKDTPTRIFIHASSVYHFDLNDPASTCLNTIPPCEEARPVLFPTLPAFYDALVSTFYQPPKKYRNSRFTSTLKVYISYLSLYSVSNKGVLYTQAGASDDPADRTLISSCYDVLKRMKYENRPHLIRSFLGVPSLAYEEGARERMTLQNERLAQLHLPQRSPHSIALHPLLSHRNKEYKIPDVKPRLTPFLNKKANGLEWRPLAKYLSIAHRLLP